MPCKMSPIPGGVIDPNLPLLRIIGNNKAIKYAVAVDLDQRQFKLAPVSVRSSTFRTEQGM